jgi:hypothetical protein
MRHAREAFRRPDVRHERPLPVFRDRRHKGHGNSDLF